MSKLETIFATPLAFADLEQPESLNAELRRFFLECEKQGERFENPDRNTHRNHALFESLFSLFDWKHAAVQQLREFCLGQLYQLIGQLNGYDLDALRRLHMADESWFHITRRNGYFGPHNHPLHSWSGVYCVCQEGDDPESDSGRLTFLNPNSPMFVDMALFRMSGAFQLTHLSLRLKPGQLVLFPSWLQHYVSPFEPKGDGLRITVAFNTRFQMQGFEPPRRPTLP